MLQEVEQELPFALRRSRSCLELGSWDVFEYGTWPKVVFPKCRTSYGSFPEERDPNIDPKKNCNPCYGDPTMVPLMLGNPEP